MSWPLAYQSVGALRVIGGSALNRFVIFLSVLGCLFAIVVWFMYTIKYAPVSLGIFALFLVIALVAESLLQRLHGRKIVAQNP